MTSALWPIVDFDDVKGGFDEKWVCVATMAVRVLHVPSIIQTPQREALHCDAFDYLEFYVSIFSDFNSPIK